MLQILGLILPIFAVIGCGRLSVAWNILTPEGLAALNGFAYWLALPALLFGSIMDSHTPQVMGIAGIYLACCIFVFASAVIIACFLFGSSLAKAAVFGLNATYGNVIFLGTPLVAAFLGTQGVAQILAIIALHSGILLPLAAVLMELGSGRPGGVGTVVIKTILGLGRNPVIMASAWLYLARHRSRRAGAITQPSCYVGTLSGTLGPVLSRRIFACDHH